MKDKKVILYIIGSAFFFSTMEVTLKIAGGGLNAMQLTIIRFFLGGLFLLPFAVIEKRKTGRNINKRNFAYMLFLGIICVPVSMMLFQLGVMNANASTAAVIFCVNPLFTTIFAKLILNDSITKRKVAALAICIIGIFCMAEPFNMAPGNTASGIIYLLAAAIVFGFYSVMGKRSIAEIGSIMQTSVSFIFGSLSLLLINIIIKYPILGNINLSDIPMILYISIGVTGLGYLFYFLALNASDAATASIVFFIKPALAPLFAVIAISERPSVSALTGIVLILIGSFVNLRGNLKKIEN